ncbi:hypothetical protein GlitD10_2277 [Gloeomargarita lithophora Alchichica-D10]|uniref:DUF29 domain-containing protein n=1 Tax=Gloeomargarita lithophora Alchichica-D10 TaxID=1188229 RepID=A0A1J0AF93_9CYAN|nr:DUF29 domain-containing protein [Gloeomargarita lithophora]APB34609.1 hypothetical protein GlitD10_2277 [Gloeomargarita lithophora Alchichica-D10]
MKESKLTMSELYETDFALWLEQTAILLKKQDFHHLDLPNLIEEVESLGKSDKRAITSYLMRLCEHLLKMQYWASERERCWRGWKREVRSFRQRIKVILKDSPSLKNVLQENYLSAYHQGRNLFLDASELDKNLIPEAPQFTLEQALDENWFP